MKMPEWIDTSSAEADFVVANTPNFLVRRFRQDKAAYQFYQSYTGEQLLSNFAEVVDKEPETLRSLVLPYLIACALSMNQEIKFLRAATALQISPQFKWMQVFVQILIDTYRPTSLHKFGPTVIGGVSSMTSDASISHASIRVS